jgi:hypothetical protein
MAAINFDSVFGDAEEIVFDQRLFESDDDFASLDEGSDDFDDALYVDEADSDSDSGVGAGDTEDTIGTNINADGADTIGETDDDADFVEFEFDTLPDVIDDGPTYSYGS